MAIHTTKEDAGVRGGKYLLQNGEGQIIFEWKRLGVKKGRNPRGGGGVLRKSATRNSPYFPHAGLSKKKTLSSKVH